MKKLFWQSEWQNIKFQTINTSKSVFNFPSSAFYSAFYFELFNKYQNYDDLPTKWKNDKKGIANEMIKLLKFNNSVLSIGCGLGFIEREIVNILPNIKIDAYDFATNANKWLVSLKNINSLNSLERNTKYKFIYCTGLLYAMTDKEIVELGEFIKKHLHKDGIFLTVDTSLDLNENYEEQISNSLTQSKNINILNVFNLIQFIKDLFRPYFYYFFKRNIYQLWGWKRDNDEIKSIFKKSGLLTHKVFSAAGQSFIMFNLKNNN